MRAVSILIGLGLVAAQPVPLPNRPDSLYSSGTGSSQVVLDAFVDLLCPDCAAAWPVLQQVIAAYTPAQLNVVFHAFPLPYHTWAFEVAQGAHVVASLNASSSAVYAYMDALFNGAQQDFWNAAEASNSSVQVTAQLAQFAGVTTGVSVAAFSNGMNDPNLNEDTRIAWKYACSRSVTGTPSFFVNNIPVTADSTWTLSDWQALLNPLFTGAKRARNAQGVSGRC